MNKDDNKVNHILKCIDYLKFRMQVLFFSCFLVDINVKDIGIKTTSKNFSDRDECLEKFINSVIKLSDYAYKNNIILLIENNVMKNFFDYLKNTTLMADLRK